MSKSTTTKAKEDKRKSSSQDSSSYAESKSKIIFAILFIGYATYTLNRKGVSLVLPKLISEGLNKSDAGLIISSQNIAYAISKFLGGVLSDRLSSKLLFGSGLFLSGLATIVFGLSSNSATLFAALWFCNGFAQGFGWPSCAKTLKHWFTPEKFGTYWSLLSASSNIAGAISPIAASFITLNFGWRTTLIVFGGVSLVMSFFGFTMLVDKPEDINLPAINPNAAPKPKGKDKSNASSAVTWIDLLKSPFIWLISFSYMIVFAAKTSASDWAQLYLIEERDKSQFVASSFTSSLEAGGFFGGILAGYLTDAMLRQRKARGGVSGASARLPVATMMMLMVVLCLHLLQFHVREETSQLFIAVLGFVLGCSLFGPIAIFGVMASEAAPSHLSGTSHAIVALAANLGAIISGLPFSLFAQAHSWGAVFFLLEILTSITVFIMIVGNNIQPAFDKKVKTN